MKINLTERYGELQVTGPGAPTIQQGDSEIARQSHCPTVITVLGPRNTPLRAQGTVADI